VLIIPRKKRRRRKIKTIDIGGIAEKYYNEFYEALGLEHLSINEKLGKELIKSVLDMIITSSSYKPSLNVLLKRIDRHRRKINKLISAILLESLSSLNTEQLEFIINYGEEVIIPYISDLYKYALKHGREDLIGYLQYLWDKYGRKSSIQCPKCGFYSIMPDLSCIVCGHIVSEEYIRERLGFDEKFNEYLSNASVARLREVIDIGFVLVSDIDIKSPREKIDLATRIYFPIYLKPYEISKIIEEIHSRKLPI